MCLAVVISVLQEVGVHKNLKWHGANGGDHHTEPFGGFAYCRVNAVTWQWSRRLGGLSKFFGHLDISKFCSTLTLRCSIFLRPCLNSSCHARNWNTVRKQFPAGWISILTRLSKARIFQGLRLNFFLFPFHFCSGQHLE